jgi:hypothetical protein
MQYTLTNDSTQVITVKRAEIIDEQERVTHTMAESTIREEAAEGKLMPGSTYLWRESFDSPYLVTDISSWRIKWYCKDIDGREFTVTGSLSQ